MYRLQRNLLPFALFLLLYGCETPQSESLENEPPEKEDTESWDTEYLDSINGSFDGSTEKPGGGGPQEGGTGEGHSPYSVTRLVTLGEGLTGTTVYVRGYVVGSAYRSAITGARFGTDNAVATNLLIADAPDETNYRRCVSVGLGKGEMRDEMNLVENPHRFGQRITVCGAVKKYMYITGIPSPLLIENPD